MTNARFVPSMWRDPVIFDQFYTNSVFLSHLAAPTIGFQQTSYTFNEGIMGEVCVTVDSAIAGTPLLAVLAYVPNTASKSV